MQHGASQGKEILLDMRDLQARQLRRVTEADSVEGAVKGFLDFWQKDTTIHLNIHEPDPTLLPRHADQWRRRIITIGKDLGPM